MTEQQGSPLQKTNFLKGAADDGRGEGSQQLQQAPCRSLEKQNLPHRDDGSSGASRVPRISLGTGTVSQHQVPSTQTLGLSTPGEVGRTLKTPGLASEQLLRIRWLGVLEGFFSGLPNQRTRGVI